MGWQTGTSWPGPVSVTGSAEGVVRKDTKRPTSHGLAQTSRTAFVWQRNAHVELADGGLTKR